MNELMKKEYISWVETTSKEAQKYLLEQLETGESINALTFEHGWQAATAQQQETINNLLAVIAKKDEALQYFVNSSGAEPSLSVAFTKAEQALALTPENVRLVEVGDVETLGGYPDTSQQICYLKIRANNGTKLYTIEVNDE
jgi:hypothetical protein